MTSARHTVFCAPSNCSRAWTQMLASGPCHLTLPHSSRSADGCRWQTLQGKISCTPTTLQRAACARSTKMLPVGSPETRKSRLDRRRCMDPRAHEEQESPRYRHGGGQEEQQCPPGDPGTASCWIIVDAAETHIPRQGIARNELPAGLVEHLAESRRRPREIGRASCR